MDVDSLDLNRDPLEVLFDLGGFYECPKAPDGKRLGPLVGYAGRDEQGRQYVGDLYANFAEAEQHRRVYHDWAERLAPRLQEFEFDTFMGMPMGSIMVAEALGRVMNKRVIFAEKKITALATETSREKSELVLARHGVRVNERIVVCEDVTNNFSTTLDAVRVVSEGFGVVTAIATMLNRSSRDHFEIAGGQLPVVALVHKPLPQYRQDDSAVADDIARGNVIWKPKAQWSQLEAVMREHR